MSAFSAPAFARATLARDPYASRSDLGAQIARAASARGGRYFEATDLPGAWSPPAGYDASEEAVERRIAAGEESERRYERAREERRDLEDEYGPCAGDEEV